MKGANMDRDDFTIMGDLDVLSLLYPNARGMLPGKCPDCGATADWDANGNLVCRSECGWHMLITDDKLE